MVTILVIMIIMIMIIVMINDIMYDDGKNSDGSIRSLVYSELLTGVTILSRSAGATLRRYNEAALLQVS